MKDSNLTRVHDYLKEALPWAHGHQLNALTTFVLAIFEQQTGCQAELARTQGKQEAACKRLSRLIHNERLSPNWPAEGVAHQALSQVPPFGKVRLTMDWTSEGSQHLLTISLVIGRRAIPIYWRAYDQNALQGRMRLYERAVIKRAFQLIFQSIRPKRVRLTADRGFADEPLFALLQRLRVRFVIRVKGCVKVCFRREWRKLNRFGFYGNCRHQTLGRLLDCEKSPRRLWVHQSRARKRAGAVGDLVLGQQLRQRRAPSHDRIFAALQLRRGLQGREMVSRIQAGACQRHPSLVTIVCALCPGAADPDNAGDLLLATRRSKNKRTLAARSFATTWPL